MKLFTGELFLPWWCGAAEGHSTRRHRRDARTSNQRNVGKGAPVHHLSAFLRTRSRSPSMPVGASPEGASPRSRQSAGTGRAPPAGRRLATPPRGSGASRRSSSASRSRARFRQAGSATAPRERHRTKASGRRQGARGLQGDTRGLAGWCERASSMPRRSITSRRSGNADRPDRRGDPVPLRETQTARDERPGPHGPLRATAVGLPHAALPHARPDRGPRPGIIDTLTEASPTCWADKAYQDVGRSLRVPVRDRRLKRWKRRHHTTHTKIRCVGEQAMATLKSWRLLPKLRCGTDRITDIEKAVLVLHHPPARGGERLSGSPRQTLR